MEGRWLRQALLAGQIAQDSIEFTLLSKDGDMGFPGSLAAKVVYTLEDCALRLDYSATTIVRL